MKRSPANQLRALLFGLGLNEAAMLSLQDKSPKQFREFGERLKIFIDAGHAHITQLQEQEDERTNETDAAT